MRTNITISLDTRRAKRDGTYPIVLRISHQQRTAVIQTGYAVPKQDWNFRRREVKQSYKGVSSVSRLNHRLIKFKAEALDRIKELEEKDQLYGLPITELKHLLTRKESPLSFFAFMESLIEDFKIAKRFGNARSYFTVLGVLKGFCQNLGKDDLEFREVTYRFLKQLEHHHLAKGNSINGLAVYMRTIRAVYNYGIKAGMVERESYPFHEYKIQTEPTKKRAISVEHLRNIVNLSLSEEEEPRLFHYRNYFLTSYLLWGISFMDLAFLQVENIVNDRVQYRRRKTGKLYDIKLTEQLSEILSYYIADKNPQDFIFPIIKREQLDDQYKDILWERKRYNTGLEEIASRCGIEEKLTSYVARHSFATQALFNEIPLKAISQMLGHSKLSTTEIYLKSLPSNVLDSYADRLSL
ncbi:MAG: site-specific integrase [Bacteroidota bacterium]